MEYCVGISTAVDALTHTERLPCSAGFAASLLRQAGQALQAVLQLAALALRCSMSTLRPAHTTSGTRARL